MKYLCALICCLAFATLSAQPGTLKVATYNIRYDNADDAAHGNGWTRRLPQIISLVRFQDFDIFGTQEGLSHQLKGLLDSLPGYHYIGVGRDDGRDAGEHAAIFFKTAMFRLLDKGNFWLSADTAKPNKGWDAALPRICSWGKFRVVKTGFVFYCFNLHMDHQGVIARKESAKLVLAAIRRRAGHTPVILTGDFNADQDSEPYSLLAGSGTLSDAYTAAAKWAAGPTFNGFSPVPCGAARIDHIFLTRELRALQYGILNNTYPDCDGIAGSSAAVYRCPSDHFPVTALLEYNTAGSSRER